MKIKIYSVNNKKNGNGKFIFFFFLRKKKGKSFLTETKKFFDIIEF